MNIAVLHPQCRVRGGAIKMALLTAQSLQKQGHHVVFYTFDHDPECFPELQEGLTIVTGRTTQSIQNTKDKVQNGESIQSTKYKIQSEGMVGSDNSKLETQNSKHHVDTVDKHYSFWSLFHSAFPRFSSMVGIAWDIRQVDIVIAHNPPMQIVGALAKILSFFSPYHQRLVVIWWHHHIPWYYIPKVSIQNTKDKVQSGNEIQKTKYKVQSEGKHFDFLLSLTNFFSMKGWKGWFERHYVLPRVKYLVATSYYTAYCIEKYCGRKAIVMHPVITESGLEGTQSPDSKIQNTKYKIQNEGGTSVIPAQAGIHPEKDKQQNDPARPITLFTHGRLEPGKGLDTLIKAWKELQTIQNTKYKIQSEGMVGSDNSKLETQNSKLRDIKLIIAGDGSLKNWLIEQGATVISYQDSVLNDIKKTQSDILAIYLSTIDAFGMAPLEAQIAGLPVIILDKGGARETVLLDNNQAPMAQLIDTENEILPAITYFIQQRTLQKRVSNVNFCHQREYFTVSRLDAELRSLIDSVR